MGFFGRPRHHRRSPWGYRSRRQSPWSFGYGRPRRYGWGYPRRRSRVRVFGCCLPFPIGALALGALAVVLRHSR